MPEKNNDLEDIVLRCPLIEDFDSPLLAD